MECTLERSTEVWYICNQCIAMVQNMLKSIVIILMIDNWCTQDCLPQDSRSKVLPMLQCTMCIPDICHFFTLTHFESWKFYTRKVRKFTTNLPKTVIFSFFWNFFTLSQKIYTHGVPGVPDKYQVWCCIISCVCCWAIVPMTMLVTWSALILPIWHWFQPMLTSLITGNVRLKNSSDVCLCFDTTPPHTYWHCTGMFVCWYISLSIVVCCKTPPVSKYAPHNPPACASYFVTKGRRHIQQLMCLDKPVILQKGQKS